MQVIDQLKCFVTGAGAQGAHNKDHQQGGEPGGPAELQGDPGEERRHHGCPRGPGHGDPHREDLPGTEDDDPVLQHGACLALFALRRTAAIGLL